MKPIVGLFLFAALAVAQKTPLIDRELFFGDPEISGSQISPDGKYIAFIKPFKDTRNIWVKKTEEPFGAAKVITAETRRPIPAFFWSRDSKYILFVQDQAGDENYNVYAVNPAEPAPAGAEVPKARNLTDAKGSRAIIYAVPKSDPDSIYIGLNDRDKAWHDLHKIKISSGERTLVRKNTDRITAWFFDLKGRLRLATRSADNGDTEILRVDAGGFKKVYSCGVFETCAPVRFHKDNQRVYLMTNKGSNVDLTGLRLFDPQTSREEPFESDPLKRVDFGGVHISEVTDEIVATFYTDEKTRIYFRDKSYEADYNRIRKQLKDKEVRFGSRTADERLYLMSAFSDAEPGETYLFDRKTRKLTLQYRIREKLPREHLAPMQAVKYESSDGLEIPAYLTLPKGPPAKNLPAIVLPHGGPWGRDMWGYNPLAQFLANRGYAVLQPNFRGSAGFGKNFINAGNKQWGEKMQDDVTWGAKYLAARGIADPKRIGIMGGSYGGYATLAGVAFTPDVYAAAVSIVGPSNLITLLESIPPYWEQIRKMFHERMGDPNTPEGRKQLELQSPLNSAAKIKTPLLVAQGANDPRVNKAESDQIVIALRDRGFPVEYIVAPDEGHGFARPVNMLALMAAAEKFLGKHLGARFQETASPEVAARLKEITVDPKAVVLVKKMDPGAVGVPKLAVALQPATYRYQANMQMGTQNIKLAVTTEIKEESGAWRVTDTTETPMGQAVDTTVLDKSSLVLLKRSLKQGASGIDLDFKENKAAGSLNMGGQEKPVSVDLGGPLFADAAGSAHSIACLPLAEGYTTTFRNFDVQRQKPKLMQLKVTGSESVTVPAGAFEAYKVEITSAEGGPDKVTLWIAKDSRKVAKMSAVMIQMNGAVMTAELQ
jgi:dipeptidyl aminopeptidase/acylaminoacyl peptidase